MQYTPATIHSQGLLWWLNGKEPASVGDNKFDPWVRKIPWRRKWQPTPVFLLVKFHGWRSPASYSPWDCKGVGHDWVTDFCLFFCLLYFFLPTFQELGSFLGAWCPLAAFISCIVEFTRRLNALLMKLFGGERVLPVLLLSNLGSSLVEFGESTRDCSPGHAGKEGPHIVMTEASCAFSWGAVPGWGFSQDTMGSSGSLSCGDRKDRSPCTCGGGARHCSRVMVGESGAFGLWPHPRGSSRISSWDRPHPDTSHMYSSFFPSSLLC